MRKVILGFGMTLDGYIARPDGAVDFLVMGKETAKLMAAAFPYCRCGDRWAARRSKGT